MKWDFSIQPLKRKKKKSQGGLKQDAPLVPIDSSAGRALSAVIAILTFLASLCAVGAELVAASSTEWRSSVSREITIQIRPVIQRNMDDDINQVQKLVGDYPGIAGIQVFSDAESQKLLEPWLGTGLNFNELPVPRLIVVKLAEGERPDFSGLRQQLNNSVPNAILDDHNLWVGRLATMANTVVILGVGVVLLVMLATSLAVIFATRGAMDGNKEVVDVLHFVGANDRFIAREFQKRFFQLGLRGSFYGAGLALFFCFILGFIFRSIRTTASGLQVEAMFGVFSVNIRGILAVMLIAILIAVITAFVSRTTVRGYLNETIL